MLLSQGATADAQTVAGRLLDGRTRHPIMLGIVSLMDAGANVVDQTFTNERGAFTLEARAPGDYYVVAAGSGYATKVEGVLELGDGGYITVEFYLRPEAIPLDSIHVEGERDNLERRHLEDAGFYERLERGFGYFITPEMIDRRPLSGLEDLFRVGNVPGLRLQPRPQGLVLCVMAPRPIDGPAGGVCGNIPGACGGPLTYVDGVQIATWEGGLDQVVHYNDIAAVEVYTRFAGMPLQYSVPGSGCGVVLIWTRK